MFPSNPNNYQSHLHVTIAHQTPVDAKEIVRAAEEDFPITLETAVFRRARPNVGEVRAVGLRGVVAALHLVVGHEAREVSLAWRPLLLFALT